MSFLLRRTRKAVWTGGSRNREAAAHEFERRAEDTDGLSLFEVETEEDRLIIVAAIACERENCGRVDVVEVERPFVEQYGRVASTPDKGTTPVPAANQKHCSLDWDSATLRRMAEDLFDTGTEPRVFSPAAVRGAVRSLDAASIIGEQARAFVRAELAKPSRP